MRQLFASSSIAAILIGGGTPAVMAAPCAISVSGGSVGAVTNFGAINCIDIENSTVNGGLSNANGGTITAAGAIAPSNVGITINNSTIAGTLSNAGSITANNIGIGVAGASSSVGGILNANSGLITGGGKGIVVSAVSQFGGSAAGGITNSGTISVGQDGIVVGTVSTFVGGISNTGTISAGAAHSGIRVTSVSAFSGGVANSGTLSAGSIGIFVENSSSFSGGLVNSGRITSTGNSGLVAFQITSFSGGITNSGTISANFNGITAQSMSTFSAGITNTGKITATGFTGVFVVGISTFSGGITNSGTISANLLGAVIADVSTFGGGFVNIGTISANRTGLAVGQIANFSGGITNSGIISANLNGITISAVSSFGGGIANTGTIAAGAAKTGILVNGFSAFSGGIANSSAISAGSVGIFVENGASFSGGLVNSGTVTSVNNSGLVAFQIASFSGGIANSGTINAADIGITDQSMLTFSGGIVNSGTIVSRGFTGVFVQGIFDFSGGIANSGTIIAHRIGIADMNVAVFSGGITNSGTIAAGATGIAVSQISNFTGGIGNSGTIAAGAGRSGIVVNSVPTFAGGIVNSGTVSAGSVGIFVENGSSFSGGLVNSGTITSANNSGLVAFQITSFSGGITNSGTITALDIGITDQSMSVFSGGITNSGKITATGFTGIFVSAISSFSGGLTNSGTIAAKGSGILITGVSSFMGGVTNTGTITGSVGITVSNSSALSVFDSGTITGTGGTAVDLSGNAAGNTFTLGAGYTITGNVLGTGADTFQLGGSGAATFNLSSIGASQQYRGFDSFNVVGGVWNTTGTFGQAQAWNVNGGTLAGTGTFQSVNVNAGGTLEPGTPGAPGSFMTINGNLAFASGAAYLVNLSSSTASRANVAGAVTLNGAVQGLLTPGSYSGATSYDILDPTSVTGQFTGFTALNAPGLGGTLSTTPSGVLLNLTATIGAGGGLDQNQQNAANAINHAFNFGGTAPAALFPVFASSGSNLGHVLSQLDGEVGTGAERAAVALTDQFLGLMLDPYVSRRGDAPGGPGGSSLGFAPDQMAGLPPEIASAYASVFNKAPPASTFDARWSVWGSAYGGNTTSSGNPAFGSNDTTTGAYGVAAGADYHVSPQTVVGLTLAGAGTNWALANGLGGGRSDALQAGAYGTSWFGPAYIAGALSFSNHWFTAGRSALGDQLTASFAGQSYGARAEAGYRVAVQPALRVTPYAAVQFQDFHTPSYGESDPTGAGLGLRFAAMNATDTRTELGSRFEAPTLAAGKPLMFYGRLAWAHDFVANPALGAAFQALPGASFTVNGAPIPHDSALTSAGAQLMLSADCSLSGQFDGEFARASQSYAGTATLRYTW